MRSILIKALFSILVASSFSTLGFGAGSYSLYTIESEGSGLCMDIKDFSTNTGANVELQPCNGSASQLWFLFDLPETDTIDASLVENFHSHYYIDMGSRTVGSDNVSQVESQFDDQAAGVKIVKEGEDLYSIRQYFNDARCVIASSSGNIAMGLCDDSTAHKFTIRKIRYYQPELTEFGYPKHVQIRNKSSKKILDQEPLSPSFNQGIRVIQALEDRRAYNTSANLWSIDAIETGPYGIKFYEIRNGYGINVLDVADRGQMDSIVLWRKVYPRANQLWMITATGDRDQSYYIKAKSDLTECLGLNKAGDVEMLKCSQDDQQKWILVR